MAGQTDAEQPVADGEMTPVINPAEPKDIVGYVREASATDVEQALQNAVNNAPIWFATPPQERAAILQRAAGINGRPNAAADWHSGTRSRENLQ
ncbi:trifunctional transcriptional regulator/proline dehydrogenase/pyrroline-5-carboxylate dehydrogenase [Citrobacter koseri]|nr:trifunctional transcriptional regulator/proline dehydrogenase/pyrroline-5-carboxylate dehydrogenase [Citrobacter koseri]